MNLATLLRYMQFYSHMAHNLLGGNTFFQDHSFLGDLYLGYESDFDSIIERMVGLDEEFDLIKIHKDAVKDLEIPTSFNECFTEILNLEEKLCSMIEKLVPNSSQGTANMLQGIADKSEMRQFKLKQRLK